MGLFNRKKSASAKANEAEDAAAAAGGSRMDKFMRRPGNTAFKQQRLKAWQPILTPKTVLPTFFVIGVLFAPIGGLLLWGSNEVKEFTIDYTRCENLEPSTTTFETMPSSAYTYHVGSSTPSPPVWQFQTNTAAPVNQQRFCRIQFNVPETMQAPVFMYYKLTNYYQNHRRYVRSLDTNQLKGEARSYGDVQGGDCKPLDVRDGKPIYPCGLIANSVFNDTYTSPTPITDGNANLAMIQTGIVWPGESNKYQPTKYTADQVVPPPFWSEVYGTSYQEGQLPDLHTDEHFQVWMRTAGLPTFRKLWQRSPDQDLSAGTYQMDLYMNYPVQPYHGTKSVVFSTVSWIGGRNPFLGIAYIVVAAICILLGLALTLRHLIKPRKLGDMSYLSWNNPKKDAQASTATR